MSHDHLIESINIWNIPHSRRDEIEMTQLHGNATMRFDSLIMSCIGRPLIVQKAIASSLMSGAMTNLHKTVQSCRLVSPFQFISSEQTSTATLSSLNINIVDSPAVSTEKHIL